MKETQNDEDTSNKIVTHFNIVQESKRTSYLIVKLTIISSIIIVCFSIIAALYAYNTAMKKIIVVDSGGMYLKTDVKYDEQLKTTLILNTCKQLIESVNSFDRHNIIANHGRAFYYCSKKELTPIFEKYKNEKAYLSAQERGVIYKCNLENVSSITREKEIINVHFSAILTVIDGQITTKYRINANGKLVSVTPEFPKNVTGFFFATYNQSITAYGNKNED